MAIPVSGPRGWQNKGRDRKPIDTNSSALLWLDQYERSYHMVQGYPFMESRVDKRRPVYEEIREYIGEMIRKGELREGDKLPAERKLSQKFQVSRNSVREALRSLAEMGMVESRHGDGTYVRSLSDSDWADLNRVLQGKGKRLGEIFQFRRILEPQIAALAARHVTRKEIDRLKVMVFEQERRIMEGKDDSDLDAEFHLALARATKNTVIVDVIQTLDHVLNESRSVALQSEERRRASLRTHILIVDALEKHDPERAMDTMDFHLTEVYRVAAAKGTEK